MNTQISRVALAALRPARGADRRDDLLADLGRAGLAAQQDNEIQRVAQFEIGAG